MLPAAAWSTQFKYFIPIAKKFKSYSFSDHVSTGLVSPSWAQWRLEICVGVSGIVSVCPERETGFHILRVFVSVALRGSPSSGEVCISGFLRGGGGGAAGSVWVGLLKWTTWAFAFLSASPSLWGCTVIFMCFAQFGAEQVFCNIGH